MLSRHLLTFGWVGLLALYLGTISRWLTHADSPEFVSLFAAGGVAHPPGYPTVVLMYRMFRWLPLDPRIGAGAVTAVIGALAILFLYRAARSWGATKPAAAIGAAFVGLNAQVWLVHTHPEAFAFNNMFAALILWFAAPDGPLRGARRAVALGAVGGIALGAHHSIVLTAPVGFYGLGLAARESSRPVRALGASGLTFCAGLSVYGYLLWVDSPISFGRVDGGRALLDHFLRTAYGTTKLAAKGESSLWEQWMFWLLEGSTDFGIVGFILGLFGIAAVTAGGAAPEPWYRRPKIALVAAWILAGPVFIAFLNTSPIGPNFEIVKRFHVLPAVLMGPLIAFGAQRFAGLPRRTLAVMGAGIVALMIATGVVRTRRIYDATIEDWVHNALATAPRDAVIITQGDHRYFVGQYLQEIEHLRPDVQLIVGVVLGFPWYVEQVSERTGVELPLPTELPEGGRRMHLRETVDLLLQSGRPVIVTRDWAEQTWAEYRMVPHGVGFRLLPPAADEPSAAALVATNRGIYAQFRHRADPPVYTENVWGWSVHQSYLAVWQDLARRCAEERDPCVEVARQMVARYPDL